MNASVTTPGGVGVLIVFRIEVMLGMAVVVL